MAIRGCRVERGSETRNSESGRGLGFCSPCRIGRGGTLSGRQYVLPANRFSDEDSKMKKVNRKLRMVVGADRKSTTTIRNESDGKGGIIRVQQRWDSKLCQWVAVATVKPAQSAKRPKAKAVASEKPKNKVLEAFRAEFGIARGSVLYMDCGSSSPTMADLERVRSREIKAAESKREKKAAARAFAALPPRQRYLKTLEGKIQSALASKVSTKAGV